MVDGSIDVEDRHRPEPVLWELGPSRVELVDISTIPEREGSNDVFVGLPGGGSLSASGTVVVEPLGLEGRLVVEDSELSTTWRAVAYLFDFDLTSGVIDFDLGYRVGLREDGPHLIVDGADIRIAESGFQWRDHDVDLVVTEVSTRHGTTRPFEVSATLAETARGKVKGSVGASPVALDAEVGLESLKLAKYRPYLARYAPLDLRAGVLSVAGAVRANRGDEVLEASFEGSFDTPGFGMATAAGAAAKEIFSELVKSPFGLLGKIGGGGGDQDLEFVEFAAGSAILQERAARNLETLFAGLVERPTLTLAINGSYDVEADGVGLREAAFREEVLSPDFSPGFVTRVAKGCEMLGLSQIGRRRRT